MQKTLLICGILAALLYASMIAFMPFWYEGYNSVSQTVSELSAIGTPTRKAWVLLGIPYVLFEVAFGWGVFRSGKQNRRLRIAGIAIMAHGAIAIFWPPMHQRGVTLSLTDTLHMVWAATVSMLFMLAIGFGAAALGKRFRLYSIVTIVTLLLFGGLTGMDSPNVAANLPTPWIGLWERINIAAFLTWVVVLAVALLRQQNKVRNPGTVLH